MNTIALLTYHAEEDYVDAFSTPELAIEYAIAEIKSYSEGLEPTVVTGDGMRKYVDLAASDASGTSHWSDFHCLIIPHPDMGDEGVHSVQLKEIDKEFS